jgi:hypothetical protein
MSRLSDYTDEAILEIIHAAGYQRLSGTHKNGQSVHEVLHSCGMVNLKNSKTLVSDKRGCVFIPCHERGKLSLLYLKSIAREQGLDDVTHALEGTVPLSRLKISAGDTLHWRKGNLTMTQSWSVVRSRALSSKKGTFFQPDETRRKMPSPVLTHSKLEEICAPKDLVPPRQAPARRMQKVDYVHSACGGKVALRFSELDSWDATRCPHCNPFESAALVAFNTFLADVEMTFDGTLQLLEGKSQVNRSQTLSITCTVCHQRNTRKSYDLIRYRGFTFCDNPRCRNTYLPEDRIGENDQYYVDLLRDRGIRNFADGQKLFPRAIRYLRYPSNASGNGADKLTRKYEIVQQALDLPSNARPTEYTEQQLRVFFQTEIDHGATTIGHIRAKLPNSVNNFITRCRKAGDFIHHRVLADMDIRFKRSYEIATLQDALECLLDTKCLSWAEFVSRYPGASESIIAQGFKEGVMASYGWTPLVNYSRLSDQAILDKANELCQNEKLDGLSQLERTYSSLILNIRERGLMGDLCARMGFQLPAVWQGKSLDDIAQHIRDSGFTSSTDWHASSSGSYKYAASQNWVREITKLFNWGQFKGLNGFRYDSLPETIVANMLHLADYDFIDHPPITRFPGYGGGRAMADFLIDAGPLWIEVWAYRTEDVVRYAKFEDYPAKRKYKEQGYQAHAMPLCSLEGGLFYRPHTLDGIDYRRGMSSFVRHACQRLTQHGFPITYTQDLLTELRQSVQGQSDSPVIGM